MAKLPGILPGLLTVCAPRVRLLPVASSQPHRGHVATGDIGGPRASIAASSIYVGQVGHVGHVGLVLLGILAAWWVACVRRRPRMEPLLQVWDAPQKGVAAAF